MVRLHFFVEGPTEQAFVSQVLNPHLQKYHVAGHKAALIANSYKHGKFHRGGAVNFSAMQKDIENRLQGDSARDLFFTTMIDLYRLPGEFPCYRHPEN